RGTKQLMQRLLQWRKQKQMNVELVWTLCGPKRQTETYEQTVSLPVIPPPGGFVVLGDDRIRFPVDEVFVHADPEGRIRLRHTTGKTSAAAFTRIRENLQSAGFCRLNPSALREHHHWAPTGQGRFVCRQCSALVEAADLNARTAEACPGAPT